MRIYEPAGTSPEQTAADLLEVAIQRRVLTTSCGGYIFGTTNDAFCNCYHGDHGYLEIDRGLEAEPAPGQMTVSFSVTELGFSPDDWSVEVPAPAV